MILKPLNLSKNFIKVIFTGIATILFIPGFLFSQTYSGGGGAVPDDGTDVFFPISVSGLTPQNIDTVFGLETVCINISHPWVSDLDIKIIAPDGKEILLSSGVGKDGDDYINTCFNGYAPQTILSADPPFSGIFRPIGILGNINNGQNGNGIWQLHIRDMYAFADAGTLLDWSISFGTNPAKPFVFTSTNLPLVIINTNGQGIQDEPKIEAQMGIIYNGPGNRNYVTDPFNNYDGKIGIEFRGSSSQWFPKKPYGFETRDSSGIEINAPLLGLPAESDWILSPSYSDKTFLRNVLAYKLANEMGHYASRTQFCELVLNGEYQGIYVLMEKIKRDNNRVDIAKLDSNDIAGDSLTGGYIIKIDKMTGGSGAGWTSPYPPVVNSSGQTIYFQYDYPKEENISAEQQQYIKSFIDSFETALAGSGFLDSVYGYRNFIDVQSFADYFILNEISKNVDGYRLSAFLYKDKNSKNRHLFIGPAWDFDLAWLNADYCDGFFESGWAYEFGNVCPDDSWQLPFWWQRLLQDSAFTNEIRCRWETWRADVLNLDSLHQYLDSMAAYLYEAQQRNFTIWPILGVYVWPNPSPLPQTYEEEVSRLKQWTKLRALWLDANLPGNCWLVAGREENSNKVFDVKVLPNPGSGRFTLRLKTVESGELNIYNVIGEKVFRERIRGSTHGLDISHLPAGQYFFEIRVGGKVFYERVVKE